MTGINECVKITVFVFLRKILLIPKIGGMDQVIGPGSNFKSYLFLELWIHFVVNTPCKVFPRYPDCKILSLKRRTDILVSSQ